MPDWQVPPAEVLQKMVPEESLAVLEEWTRTEYQGKRTELIALKEQRRSNLADGNFARKKREVQSMSPSFSLLAPCGPT